MDDFQHRFREDQIRREKEQQENRRHRERMALEEKRDRVASMRVRGHSEDEIEIAESKRGFFKNLFVLLVAAAAAFIFFSGDRDRAPPSATSDASAQSETVESAEPPTSVEPSLASVPEGYEADSAAEDTADAVNSSAPEQQIIFVEKPVVQSLPSEQEEDTPTAPADVTTADTLQD
ncbi:MAG: hypothetical protein K2Y17_09850 [Qipengyuania sp.]|nr:hypothetical protein [Qipengyuania sp.]